MAPSAQRSTTVFAIALAELFLLLLFLTIFLWIATIPAEATSPNARIAALEARVKQLEKELDALRKENATLKADIELGDSVLALLWEIYKKKPVILTPGSPEWKKWLKDWHSEIRKTQVLSGRGHRNCLGTGALLRLTITDDDIEIQPATQPDAQSSIQSVPAIQELIRLKKVPVIKFEELGAQILQWSERQEPPCRFDVTFVDKASQKVPYAAALRAIDKSFYKIERRG